MRRSGTAGINGDVWEVDEGVEGVPIERIELFKKSESAVLMCDE